MSVIVKGMNMPHGCYDCPVRYSIGKNSLILKEIPFRCALRNGAPIKVNKDTGFDNKCPLKSLDSHIEQRLKDYDYL